jgi:hypothetical protein
MAIITYVLADDTSPSRLVSCVILRFGYERVVQLVSWDEAFTEFFGAIPPKKRRKLDGMSLRLSSCVMSGLRRVPGKDERKGFIARSSIQQGFPIGVGIL